MFIKSLQFKKEDKTEVVICVMMHETVEGIQWSIGDIRYKKPRKRKWESLLSYIRSDFGYTRRNLDEKKKYEIQKYINFVGVDKLKEAVLNAWEQTKPDVENMFSDFMESEEHN